MFAEEDIRLHVDIGRLFVSTGISAVVDAMYTLLGIPILSFMGFTEYFIMFCP